MQERVDDTTGSQLRFVCAMEYILDVYQPPYNAKEPLVCFDETSEQVMAETRAPFPMQSGEPQRCGHGI